MTNESWKNRLMAITRGPRLPRTRGAKVLVSVLVVLALTGTATGFAWWRSHTLPENAAFRVGDRVVTKKEFDHRVDTLRALYGVQPPTDQAKLDKFRRDVAKASSVSIVLDTEAQHEGIVVPDKAAHDVLTRLIDTQLPGGGAEGRKQFIAALGHAGTSEQAVVAEIKRQMAISQLFDRVTAGSTVNDQELRDAFNKRRGEIGPPEKRRISNIVVGQRPEAETLARQLREGTPVAPLAGQHTLDESTRAKGGDLGAVAAQQLEPNYANAAFRAPQGGVFGPVQTQFGWNVGQVAQIIPKAPASFEDAKDGLRKQLESEKTLGRWRSWLHDHITAADITYADAYRPADPTSPPNVGGPAAQAGP